MKLKIILPHKIFLDEEIEKVVAEAENGSFGLLPHHIDFVTALTAGILSYTPVDENKEKYLAVDDGVLVKRGPNVIVSTRQAVEGADLGTLENTVKQKFHSLTDDERRARSAMSRLESALARRFIEVQNHA